jgi:hypothetical protein
MIDSKLPGSQLLWIRKMHLAPMLNVMALLVLLSIWPSPRFFIESLSPYQEMFYNRRTSFLQRLPIDFGEGLLSFIFHSSVPWILHTLIVLTLLYDHFYYCCIASQPTPSLKLSKSHRAGPLHLRLHVDIFLFYIILESHEPQP